MKVAGRRPVSLGVMRQKDSLMGFMSNQFHIEHEGHIIEVEAIGSTRGKTSYCLILDNERVDQTEATFGTCKLRGKLPSNDSKSPQPFVIRIKVGIFSESCTLEIGERSFKLARNK